MASLRPKLGFIQVIRGDIVEAVEMRFCEACKLWHVDRDHIVRRHPEPVEPDIIQKPIAGLLVENNA